MKDIWSNTIEKINKLPLLKVANLRQIFFLKNQTFTRFDREASVKMVKDKTNFERTFNYLMEKVLSGRS